MKIIVINTRCKNCQKKKNSF